MGFDFYIHLCLGISEETGLPFLYKYDESTNTLKRIPYDPEEFRVPDQWKKFLSIRGHHMNYYIEDIETNERGYTASMDVFEHYFPKWENIEAEFKEAKYDYWTEETHNEFEAFVKWCSKKGVFEAHWSY